MKSLEPYNKTLFALIGTVITLVAPHFNASQGLQLLTGVITVLGVFHFRNAVVDKVVTDSQQVLDSLATTDAATPIETS